MKASFCRKKYTTIIKDDDIHVLLSETVIWNRSVCKYEK